MLDSESYVPEILIEMLVTSDTVYLVTEKSDYFLFYRARPFGRRRIHS